jgi:hypothetical protein
MLLVVVGALIAFDAWPTDGSANNPETISIAQTERAEVKAAHAGSHEASASRAGRGERISARSVRAAGRRIATGGSAGAGGDQVISDLQAPGNDGSGPSGGPAAGGGGAPPPADPSVGAPLSGTDATHHVGDTVSALSPSTGSLISQTGDAVIDTVQGVVDQVMPNAANSQQQAAPKAEALP